MTLFLLPANNRFSLYPFNLCFVIRSTAVQMIKEIFNMTLFSYRFIKTHPMFIDYGVLETKKNLEAVSQSPLFLCNRYIYRCNRVRDCAAGLLRLQELLPRTRSISHAAAPASYTTVRFIPACRQAYTKEYKSDA